MSDIISKIERGEVYIDVYRVVDCDTDFAEDEKMSVELLRLAKLGQAAEKGFKQDGNFHCNKVYGDWRCKESICGWQDFCRLRNDGGVRG